MVPELVTNGKLTDKGQKLAGWLNKTAADIADDVAPKWELRHWRMVVVDNELLTPEQFFKDYPEVSSNLWTHYMRSLPDDDPDKALADLDSDEETKVAQKRRAAAKADESTALLNNQGVLTTEGRTLSDVLARYAPDTSEGRHYVSTVHILGTETAESYFRTFPAHGRILQEWYQQTAGGRTGKKAIAYLEKKFRAAPKPSSNEAALHLIEEAMSRRRW